MNCTIQGMSRGQLLALQSQIGQQLSQTKMDRRNEIREQHSEQFIKAIGMEILVDIPVVKAKDINLQNPGEFPEYLVTPKVMGKRSTAAGLDGRNRPFIAMKVELFMSKTNEKVAQFVEVILKRHPIDGKEKKSAIGGNHYVSALTNKLDDGTCWGSWLSASQYSSLTEYKMLKMGQLLRGEVFIGEASNLSMRLVK